MDAKAIHHHKGLKPSQKILDHMGYEELAANLFRATQTEAKIKRDNIQGKENANQTHYNVGKEVRDTISRLGGTMSQGSSPPQLKALSRSNASKRNWKIDRKTAPASTGAVNTPSPHSRDRTA